jgi:hypothetical protein
MNILFRFVPHHLVQAYKDLGWEDRGPSPGHHGAHSHTMRWESQEDRDPPEPMEEAA